MDFKLQRVVDNILLALGDIPAPRDAETCEAKFREWGWSDPDIDEGMQQIRQAIDQRRAAHPDNAF